MAAGLSLPLVLAAPLQWRGARYPHSTMGSPQVLVLRVLALGGPYASSGGSASLVATCKHPLRVEATPPD